MTRPDWCDEQTWERAKAAYAECQMRPMRSSEPYGAAVIAKAIMVERVEAESRAATFERQRNAKMSDDFARFTSAAIRNGDAS